MLFVGGNKTPSQSGSSADVIVGAFVAVIVVVVAVVLIVVFVRRRRRLVKSERKIYDICKIYLLVWRLLVCCANYADT